MSNESVQHGGEIGRFESVIARSSHAGVDDAIADLVAQIGETPIQALTYFASPEFDFPALARRVHDTFGTPSIGCTTAGEICSAEGHCEHSVVATALRSPSLRMETTLIERARDFTPQRAVAELGALNDRCGGASFGLLLVDGMSMAEEKVCAAVSHALKGVPFVGGSAGDDLAFQMTQVAANGVAATGAAAIGLVRTSLPFRVFQTHHFEASDERLVVTGAIPSERRVTEINGEPATVGYARAIGVPVEDLSPAIFAEHPVMLRIGGEYFILAIQRSHDDGSLSFYCAIDQGLVLRLGSGESLPARLASEFDRIEGELGGIELIIGFDCILRRLELLNRGQRDDVREILGRAPVAGFSTYGEQYNGVHVSQTLTGVAIGRAA